MALSPYLDGPLGLGFFYCEWGCACC